MYTACAHVGIGTVNAKTRGEFLVQLALFQDHRTAPDTVHRTYGFGSLPLSVWLQEDMPQIVVSTHTPPREVPRALHYEPHGEFDQTRPLTGDETAAAGGVECLIHMQ